MESELYHVLNRGVDKRQTFMDNGDYARFVHNLYEFNDTAPAQEYGRRPNVGHRMSHIRERLVVIHAWCLMRNHYHLLLSPLIENGISLFMKKLGMGYAKYFNEKHGRTGALWQGKYRRLLIERDAHFIYIPYYIHLNPLDYAFPAWRKGSVQNVRGALAYLESYRWSSHLDYLGMRNFPSVMSCEEFAPLLGTKQAYENSIADIVTTSDLAESSVGLE